MYPGWNKTMQSHKYEQIFSEDVFYMGLIFGKIWGTRDNYRD